MYATPIRIVIADDHAIFRDGFKLLLKDQDRLLLCGEAGHGQELLEVVVRTQPDVVITDIKMPGMDGVELCQKIRKEFPSIQVIALSMFNDDYLIMDMLEAGARGYLLKNTTRDELLEAVTAVHEGDTYYCAATSVKLARLIADSKFELHKPPPPGCFTNRELQILKLICEQLTSREIALQLGLSMRTVESHREKIQEKTGARNPVGIVIYAIRTGLFEVYGP